jgi:hypothetical protein
MACGHFSDISFVAAGKKRGFCRLGRRKPAGCRDIRFKLNATSAR